MCGHGGELHSEVPRWLEQEEVWVMVYWLALIDGIWNAFIVVYLMVLTWRIVKLEGK